MAAVNYLRRGRYGLSFPYSQRAVSACKQIPGLVWDPDRRMWLTYADGLELLAEKLGWSLDQVDETTSLPAAASDVWDKLLPYQQEDVAWMVDHAAAGVICGHPMGGRKTAAAIVAARELAFPVVVVCPAFVRGVWSRELQKWWPGVLEVPLWGTTTPNVYVIDDAITCHYDILHAHVKGLLAQLRNFTLILDEGHMLQSEKSRRAQACRELAAAATYRIALTGTPFTNRPRDLWNLVDTLSPGRFGTFFKYASRYCGAVQKTVGKGEGEKVVWDFSGRSNEDELASRLKTFMIRRSERELDLPPLTRELVELRVGKVAHMNNVQDALGVAADAKMPQLVSMLEHLLNDGHNVVCFTHRRDVAAKLAAKLDGEVVHGGMNIKRRDKIIEGMRAMGGLLCATIDSCGVGIDLTWADVAVFGELSYEWHKLAQAEKRLARPGQQKHVTAMYAVGLGTADELVRDKVLVKLETASKLALGDDDGEMRQALKGARSDAEEIEAAWKSLGG